MQNTGPETVIHTTLKPPEKPAAPVSAPVSADRKTRRRERFAERLLRNTAIACALLLSVLTLKNVDTPWSQAAVSGIKAALTMRIDPDESLGRLSFVRSVIPESTLVFFNISGAGPLEPVDGEELHPFMAGQPWTLYSCEPDAPVRSALAGVVSAVSELENGGWCVMIDHGGGVETMYAYTDRPTVDAGDSVARGETIAVSMGGEVYYEYRVNGESVSPGGEAGI